MNLPNLERAPLRRNGEAWRGWEKVSRRRRDASALSDSTTGCCRSFCNFLLYLMEDKRNFVNILPGLKTDEDVCGPDCQRYLRRHDESS